jgi:hypothetical protein
MKILKITTHWNAEDAELVYQLLDELKEAIWLNYGQEITQINQHRHEQQQNHEIDDEFNDDIPF